MGAAWGSAPSTLRVSWRGAKEGAGVAWLQERAIHRAFDIPVHQPPLPRSLPRSWADAKPSADIALPQRNDYLPTDFTLRCDQQAAQPAPDGAEQQADGGAAAPNGKQQAAAEGGQQQANGDGAGAAAAESTAFPSPPTLLLDEPGGLMWEPGAEEFGRSLPRRQQCLHKLKHCFPLS